MPNIEPETPMSPVPIAQRTSPTQSFHETPAASYSGKRIDRRRHSLRSIKRRKFDDEIVESSLASKGIRRPLDGSHPDEMQDNLVSPCSSITASSPFDFTSAGDGNVLPSKSHHGKPSSVHLLTSFNLERKSTIQSDKKRLTSNQRKKLKKTRQAFAAVKDMGRWKPVDDILLIDAVEQMGELSSVHIGVKFSCHFTLEEVQERWYALLYDPVISSLARQAMKSLPREVIRGAHAKAPFSKAEETLMCEITSNSSPTLEQFQSLLEENIEVFRVGRTPQSLLRHWNLLHQYQLLGDQVVQPLPKGDHVLNFSNAEDMLDDAVLSGPKDEVLVAELSLADRRQKREIKQLEEENERWKMLVFNVADSKPASQFDEQTVGVLQGRLVMYLMRSKEITLGRITADVNVDVDLSLEGPAMKVSRKQGTIKLKKNGEFMLSNTGKRPILVDGKPVANGSKARLSHNSVIELGLLRFVFIVNEELVNSSAAK